MQTGLILSVPGLPARVAEWRRAVLPGVSLDVPPHLTLLFPWVEREPAPEDRARVRQATGGVAPFSVRFREVGTFAGFVWLRPEPADPVRAVCVGLAAAFAEFPPYAGQHPDVVPHLTVATCSPGETAGLAARVTAALADPGTPRLGPFRARGVDAAWRRSAEDPFTLSRLSTFHAPTKVERL